MSQNTQKIYAPITAIERQTTAGQFFRMSFNAEKMKAWIDQHKNEKGYVNLDMGKRREVGKYKETHAITLNTWKPDGAAPQRTPPPAAPPQEEDSVPY
jgi:hypothetical protein